MAGLHIVVGYRGSRASGVPFLVYLGRVKSAAVAAAEALTPEEANRVEFFSNPPGHVKQVGAKGTVDAYAAQRASWEAGVGAANSLEDGELKTKRLEQLAACEPAEPIAFALDSTAGDRGEGSQLLGPDDDMLLLPIADHKRLTEQLETLQTELTRVAGVAEQLPAAQAAISDLSAQLQIVSNEKGTLAGELQEARAAAARAADLAAKVAALESELEEAKKKKGRH